MADDLKNMLARIEGYIEEVQKDSSTRLAVIDKLMRGVSVKVDLLERRADVQRRLDAVNLRTKAHLINEKILKLLDGDNPDVTSAAKLFIIKNILEVPVDLGNPQLLKSLASAARSLGVDTPMTTNPEDSFQV